MVSPKLHYLKKMKLSKTFNTYFESVNDSLKLFEWIGEHVDRNERIEQIIVNFSKHFKYI